MSEACGMGGNEGSVRRCSSLASPVTLSLHLPCGELRESNLSSARRHGQVLAC